MKAGIISLKNIKGFDDLEVDLKGQSVFLMGPNGTGKTTIQQIMDFVFYEKLKWDSPIKVGETNAEGKVEIIDEKGRKYYATVTFEEKPDGTIKQKYVLEGEDGGKFTQKKQRDGFFGDRFSFDVSKFLIDQGSAAGRQRNLKNYILPVLGVDIDEIQGRIAEKIEVRRDLKSGIKTLETLFVERQINISEVEDTPEKKDLSSMFETLQSCQEGWAKFHNANEIIASVESKVQAAKEAASQYDSMAKNTWDGKKKSVEDQISSIKDQIQTLMNRVGDLNGELKGLKTNKPQECLDLEAKAQAERDKIPAIETQATEAQKLIKTHSVGGLPELDKMEEEYKLAVEANSRLEAIDAMKSEVAQLKKNQYDLAAIQKEIDKEKKNLGETLKKACEGKLPENYVVQLNDKYEPVLYYKEGDSLLLFSEDQINTAKIIQGTVALGIALKKNSKIRVINLSRGESLDKETRKLIQKITNEAGFQLVMEKVVDEGKLELEYITNGSQ